MRFAAIARCPVTFGTIKSVDKSAAEEISGVEKIIKMDRMTPPTGKFFGMLGGVAVVANNTWAAFQGKLSLEIDWDFGDNKAYNTEAYDQKINERLLANGKLVPGSRGNVTNAFKESTQQVIEGDLPCTAFGARSYGSTQCDGLVSRRSL